MNANSLLHKRSLTATPSPSVKKKISYPRLYAKSKPDAYYTINWNVRYENKTLDVYACILHKYLLHTCKQWASISCDWWRFDICRQLLCVARVHLRIFRFDHFNFSFKFIYTLSKHFLLYTSMWEASQCSAFCSHPAACGVCVWKKFLMQFICYSSWVVLHILYILFRIFWCISEYIHTWAEHVWECVWRLLFVWIQAKRRMFVSETVLGGKSFFFFVSFSRMKRCWYVCEAARSIDSRRMVHYEFLFCYMMWWCTYTERLFIAHTHAHMFC